MGGLPGYLSKIINYYIQISIYLNKLAVENIMLNPDYKLYIIL
jgi:hypothetical protein